MRKAAIALFGLLLTSFAACNRDGVIEADASPAPVIALDSETAREFIGHQGAKPFVHYDYLYLD